MSTDLVSARGAGDGVLRRRITRLKSELKVSLSELTVLSEDNDPYRLDTPAGHRDAAWLAGHLERFGYLDLDAIDRGDHRKIHLRGVHYSLVSTEGLRKPNGDPYQNTNDDWEHLQERAAKCARWLGHLPFEVIADVRNSPPKLHRRRAVRPHAYVSTGVDVTIPSVDDISPQVEVTGFTARQAYHLVLFGEKTSLEEVLLPIARRYDADLYLPAGEISDTLLYQMAADGAADGRPMVVFVFADCDPAGHQMAISIGRKLQASRDLLFPTLQFEVHPVALTVEQVREYGLPSTPLKETERRADRWRQAFEQTEIDALAALRPDLLRRIAVEAVAPVFDDTLEARVVAARWAWLAEAQATVDAQLDADQLGRVRERAAAKLAELASELAAINAALRTATDDLDLSLPPFEVPEPEVDGAAAEPLISSEWTWYRQTTALIHRKKYRNGG